MLSRISPSPEGAPMFDDMNDLWTYLASVFRLCLRGG
jgi:hypothetical protein